MKDHIDKKWKVLSSDYLSKEPWFTARREKVQLPNGNIIPSYYILEYPDWINVIAITREGKFIIEKQYRHASGITTYELCAGVCEKEDASPLASAKRELLEETGYGNGAWQELVVTSANPSTHTNKVYCYLATDVEKISEPHLENTEDIDVYLLSPEEVLSILESGEIIQATQALPLWKYFYEKEKNKLSRS